MNSIPEGRQDKTRQEIEEEQTRKEIRVEIEGKQSNRVKEPEK